MGASSTAGLGQALDFRDECDALHSALENAPAEAWAEPTQFKGWTFDDVLGHLYFFDHAAEIAARSRDDIQALFRGIFQPIFDALGIDRVEHDRLRNIAVMGVNTFDWTFKVNRRDVPAVKPYVRLRSPSGALWEWNDPATVERVEGSAVEFCRVVTQTRNLADTTLAVTGGIARHWLERAQCFAGPPEQPPAPGTRFKQGHYDRAW